MPRLPRRYTLRQKSPNASQRIRGALREISEPLTTIVDFDWDSYNVGCQKLIGVIKSSKASVREPTESGSGSPETKDRSIVMAEISYPRDAEGCEIAEDRREAEVRIRASYTPCP